ncbi:MAG: T9SS type A sorting domain-containing protein [Candidatus Cloacimonadales bacterium]|nr:T9SS type A sorting domain-containing protein [Candidatus Cloacimonadales bacterium]
MKKAILFLVMISLGVLFAELQIDIPFDQNIVGEDFSVVGPYTYESEWMTITNIGTTTETYTLTWTYESLPTNWTVSVCNPEFCLSPNWPVPLTLAPGEFEELHISINVTSTGGFDINITLAEGDLTEPISLDFRFDTADNVNAGEELIQAFKLRQNYPNPFNPSTTISFSLTAKDAQNAKLEIYNVKGQKIKTFSNLQIAQSPNQQIVWNGLDDAGKATSSGIYFYQLRIGEQSFTRKMVLLK